MDWTYLTPMISVVAVAFLAFAYTWYESGAYDRKWGKRPPAE